MTLTPEQIERKKEGVGASEAAAAAGLNEYCSPSRLWRRRMGLEVFHGNLATKLGERFERPIADAYAEEILGTTVAEQPDTAYRRDHPWWLCHADFILANGLGVEVKNHGGNVRRSYLGMPGERGDWDNDLVPLIYHIQCQWTMGVMVTHQEWRLVAYFGGDDLRGYRIKRDNRMIAALGKTVEKFWFAHLDPAGATVEPDDSNWQTKGPVARPLNDRHARLPASDLLSAPIPTPKGVVT